MCTAIALQGEAPLFGRTLDLEYSYDEQIIISPKRFCLEFLHEKSIFEHYAMIGVGIVSGGVPLYYDAMNEKGLAAAALNFPFYAHYAGAKQGACNLASFEFIPYLLSQCATVKEAREVLCSVNVTPDDFSSELCSTPLHWILFDGRACVTVEQTEGGLRVYDNPYGALTNSPPFPYHTAFLSNFAALSEKTPDNLLCPDVPLQRCSRGMGGIGLPGDFSSFSRFVRAVFLKNHRAACSQGEEEVCAFFHIMDNLAVPVGAVKTEEGRDVVTVYTSCADIEERVYYFNTHANRQIRAVRLADVSLDASCLYIASMAQKNEAFALTPKESYGKIGK